MSVSEDRPRPRPSDRLAGDERLLDMPVTLQALRAEGPGAQGHRQIALLHQPSLRLVLFAFEAGGRIKEHSAPGWVTIHVLRGTLLVGTATTRHELRIGMLLSLAPGVKHDVEATEETDMLLGISPEQNVLT